MKYTDGFKRDELASRRSATDATSPMTQSRARSRRCRSPVPARRKPGGSSDAGMPIARRMPISRVLSVTTMISVLMMLNAATSTISSRMSAIAELLELERLNSELFCCCQSTRAVRACRACLPAASPTSGASHARRRLHLDARSLPCPSCASSCAASSEMMTYWLSYSYIPVSKIAGHLERLDASASAVR